MKLVVRYAPHKIPDLSRIVTTKRRRSTRQICFFRDEELLFREDARAYNIRARPRTEEKSGEEEQKRGRRAVQRERERGKCASRGTPLVLNYRVLKT